MYRSNSARIVPIIIFVVVAAALIFGLVTVGRYIFGGTRNDTDQVMVDQSRDELITVDTERTVRMIVRGPIVADEEFRTYEISISPNQRVVTLYNGYREAVEERERYSNNTPAYEEFVYALDKAAFTTPGALTESEASDVRGICATGRVFEYELFDDDARLQRYWTSTCKGSPGTLGADTAQITNLFVAQVPEDTEIDFSASFRRLGF